MRFPAGRVWLGWALLPLLVLLDTAAALASGWKLRSAGALALAPVLAAVLLVVITGVWWLARRRVVSHAGLASWRWIVGSLAVLVGMAGGEFLAQAVAPRPAFHLQLPGAKYEYDPNPDLLPGVSGHAVTTINALGLRGPELPPRDEAYRILCVGGSAAEGNYLDDAETWPALLSAELNATAPERRVWTGAAAVSELATGQHVQFLHGWRPARDMDCWLLLVGPNDFLRLVLDYEVQGHPPLWLCSAPAQLTRRIWNVRFRNGFVVDPTGDDLTLYRREFAIPARQTPDLPAALDGYAGRIRALIQTARAAGVRPVFVCQPVLWDEFLTPRGKRRLLYAREYPFPRDWKYLRAGNFRDAIDQYHERLQQVCTAEKVECVTSLLELNGREACFYDDFLPNEQGCREAAARLAQYFRDHPRDP